MSWSDTWDKADAADMDIAALKAELPLQYVINHYGVALESVGERLRGLCPFHEDTNPSFAVWGDNLETCGCWSCDFSQGDLFDFIERQEGITLKEALPKARDLYVAFSAEEDWVPLTVTEGQAGDPENFRQYCYDQYLEYENGNHGPLDRLVMDKGLDMDAGWIHTEWWVGTAGEHIVVIPHPDETGTFKGYKTRFDGAHPYAVSGARFPAMYGQWRAQNHERVIICEGESDAWWTSWVFRKQKYDVFALPTGAGTPCRAEWQEYLNGKDCYIMFDGDEAGRTGAERWYKALVGKAKTVYVVPMVDGKDAATLSAPALQKAVRNALRVEQFPVGIAPQVNGYIRNSNGVLVTDWLFFPDKFLELEDGYGFEGVVTGQRNRKTTVTSWDLSSKARVKEWSAAHKRNFFGTENDLPHILKHLELKRPFMTQGRGVNQVGWHDGAFILPQQVIGDSDAAYVPGDSTREWDKFIGIGEMPVGDPRVMLPAMLALHRPGIVKPLMAWTAVSALRSLVPLFPIFHITGRHDSGKTSLTHAVLQAFGYNGKSTNLSDTTPYAIAQQIAGSNGVPCWVDEYRPGGKEETQKRFDQIVRDAWDGAESKRGGMGENYTKVRATPASSPLIVTGENTFEEGSLLARSLRFRLAVEDPYKNPDALEAVLDSEVEIGSLWIEWLVREWSRDALGIPRFSRRSRPETALDVVMWGWALLSQWAEREYGVQLGEWEIEQSDEVVGKDAGQINDPILEAVLHGLGEVDSQYRALVEIDDHDRLKVRTRQVIKLAHDHKIMLPGGERAINGWLIEWAGGGYTGRLDDGDSRSPRALILREGSGTALMALADQANSANSEGADE